MFSWFCVLWGALLLLHDGLVVVFFCLVGCFFSVDLR